jgi:hypothetical protein
MRNLTAHELEAKLPKLTGHNYRKTSDASARYNCMSFANDRDRQWWEAGLHGGRYYWPPNTPDTLDGWVKIFTDDGYEITTVREVEAGFEKVAIYVDLKDTLPSHVAKSNGSVWKSKLGRYQDIEHSTLDLLEGDTLWEYGVVERILRRPVKPAVAKKRRR